MTDFLVNYGLFLVKSITIVIAFLICVAGFFAVSRKDQSPKHGKVNVKELNKELQAQRNEILENVLDKKSYKSHLKAQKKAEKEKKTNSEKPKLFVLDFKGDMKASQVETLRELITAIIAIANPAEDEVLLRLESPGGIVTGYGLAASQLDRFRNANLKLTVAVDQVAASGGYLMACVADKILAAPFAIVGSIGVITAIPNFHKVLKKNDIDYEQFTAGDYKRTVTTFSETTPEGRAKKQEQVEDIHTIFKNFLRRNRPQVDLSKVATGEYWLASDTLSLNLVDELMTSDDYIAQKLTNKAIFHLSLEKPKSLLEKLLKKGEDGVLKLFNPTKI